MHERVRIRDYAQKADQRTEHSKSERRGNGIDIRDCFEELADSSRQNGRQAFASNLEDCLEEDFRDCCYYTSQKFIHGL